MLKQAVLSYPAPNYETTLPIYITEFQLKETRRAFSTRAIRNYTQRRNIYKGSSFLRTSFSFELYIEFLEAMFSLAGNKTIGDGSTIDYYYTLTNANKISDSNKVKISYETYEGLKERTNWGVLSELRLAFPSDKFLMGSATINHLPEVEKLTEIPAVTFNKEQLTPLQLSAYVTEGSTQTALPATNLEMRLIRKLTPKVTVKGGLADIYIESQNVEFQLSVVNKSEELFGSLTAFEKFREWSADNSKLQLDVFVNVNGVNYAITFPEFSVLSVDNAFNQLEFTVTGAAIGVDKTQVQFTKLM